MDAGKLQLIKESDFVLSACGRFVPPVGSVVYIPKSFLLQAALPPLSNQTFYKEITGDTTWCWRSISVALSGNPPDVYAQVLRPDGHFLFNGLLDLTAIAGFGSYRYLLSREIECPPGSKVQVTFDDEFTRLTTIQPVSFLCGGAYAYYLKNGIRSRCLETEASNLPRVFGGVNQNLLAPCWMNGEGPVTPEGLEDIHFIYGNGQTNIATVTMGHSLSTKATIQIDNENDFQLRRFLFDVRADDGVTGTWLVRIRSGRGYVLTDDYVDVAQYIGSSYFAKGWDILQGDQIQFDCTLVDPGGVGNISIEFFADGVKRRKKVA